MGGFLILALGVAGGMSSGAAQQWMDYGDIVKADSSTVRVLYGVGRSLIGTAVYAYCYCL